MSDSQRRLSSAGTHTMECMNVARGDRRKVTDGMRYPFAVTSLGNTIYYTDWQRFDRCLIRNISEPSWVFLLICLILFLFHAEKH